MSIATYTDLQSAMVDLHHRSDLTAKQPNMIALAEATILRELKPRATEASTSGTATGTIAFPAGLGSIVRLEVVISGTRYALDYASPGIEDTTVGPPYKFTVQQDSIRLIPTPDSTYTYTLHYIPNLTPLSATNTSNWLLLNCPDVYLYGAMCQYALETMDDDSMARYAPLFKGAMDSVRRSDEARRIPVSGGLQIKPRHVR